MEGDRVLGAIQALADALAAPGSQDLSNYNVRTDTGASILPEGLKLLGLALDFLERELARVGAPPARRALVEWLPDFVRPEDWTSLVDWAAAAPCGALPGRELSPRARAVHLVALTTTARFDAEWPRPRPGLERAVAELCFAIGTEAAVQRGCEALEGAEPAAALEAARRLLGADGTRFARAPPSAVVALVEATRRVAAEAAPNALDAQGVRTGRQLLSRARDVAAADATRAMHRYLDVSFGSARMSDSEILEFLDVVALLLQTLRPGDEAALEARREGEWAFARAVAGLGEAFDAALDFEHAMRRGGARGSEDGQTRDVRARFPVVTRRLRVGRTSLYVSLLRQ